MATHLPCQDCLGVELALNPTVTSSAATSLGLTMQSAMGYC